MKKATWLWILLIALGAAWVADFLRAAGQFKSLEPHFEGSCEAVAGIAGGEDITVDQATGVAYISAFDRARFARGDAAVGTLYSWDLEEEREGPLRLTAGLPFDFRPHGLSLYRGSDGPPRLFVVNHRDEGHFIEIFELADGEARHLESLTDPLLRSPNDVVAVGPRSFYATNDHGNTSQLGRTLEDYLRLERSDVVFFDGDSYRIVAAGIGYANGINVSADGDKIFVAASTGQELRVYDRDGETGDLDLERRIPLATGADNVERDGAGDLWIGAHPQMLKFVRHAADPSLPAPSQVLRVAAAAGPEPRVDEIFLSLGEDLSASSVAAVYGKTLLIGPVLDDHILSCRMGP